MYIVICLLGGLLCHCLCMLRAARLCGWWVWPRGAIVALPLVSSLDPPHIPRQIKTRPTTLKQLCICSASPTKRHAPFFRTQGKAPDMNGTLSSTGDLDKSQRALQKVGVCVCGGGGCCMTVWGERGKQRSL
jgi:hypothetical protein